MSSVTIQVLVDCGEVHETNSGELTLGKRPEMIRTSFWIFP